MTKKDRQEGQLEHVSGGGHLGGTHFGQAAGDAKTKYTEKGGNAPRPNQPNR